ncbi:hypothetical protein CDG60_09780 [Acinetobacter chinensis]|uniref:Uncharacterized protein n=1 Tax=Acinetobacter chinensis TaxID=2004650 RepID=A0A3B7LWF8_9GAMM|nr:hypothetical protein [Acinetobacter chinensis]AXY56828.1 hypothetical protein CDG60_09780 [Acinetobacter chinensis]
MVKHEKEFKDEVYAFIKEQGVDRIKNSVEQFEGDPNFTFKTFDPCADCCFDIGLYAGKEKAWLDVCVYDLKQIVESHKLLEDFFNLSSVGVEKCLQSAKAQIQEYETNSVEKLNERFAAGYSCTVERMRQAIDDVEACN